MQINLTGLIKIMIFIQRQKIDFFDLNQIFYKLFSTVFGKGTYNHSQYFA